MMLVICNIYVYIILFLYSLSGSGNRELATLKKQDKLAEAAYRHLDANVNFELDEDDIVEPKDHKYLEWEAEHKINTSKGKIDAGKLTQSPNNFEHAKGQTNQPGVNSQAPNELEHAKQPEYDDDDMRELEELEANHFQSGL